MNNLAVKIWLSVLLLASGGYAGVLVYRSFQAMEEEVDYKADLNLKPTRPIGEFKFTERSGKEIKLGDLEGHVTVINFFFANCPGTCRVLNQKVADLQKEFAKEDVRFVSITIDPATDTPERLTKYAHDFTGDSDQWWFLTGPLRDTQELGRALRLTAVGVDELGRPTHTDEIVVLDRAGTVRGAFDHREASKLEKAREKIRDLLEEKAPAAATSAGPSATAKPSATPTASATARPAASATTDKK